MVFDALSLSADPAFGTAVPLSNLPPRCMKARGLWTSDGTDGSYINRRLLPPAIGCPESLVNVLILFVTQGIKNEQSTFESAIALDFDKNAVCVLHYSASPLRCQSLKKNYISFFILCSYLL